MSASKSKPKKKIRYVSMYSNLVLKADGTIDRKRSSWNKVRFSDGRQHLQVPISIEHRHDIAVSLARAQPDLRRPRVFDKVVQYFLHGQK